MTATPAMQNAAFAYVMPHLSAAIIQYVPPFFQYEVQQKLNDPQFQQAFKAVINGALDAALAQQTTGGAST